MMFYSIIWQAQTTADGIYVFYKNRCEVIGHKEICWNFCYFI